MLQEMRECRYLCLILLFLLLAVSFLMPASAWAKTLYAGTSYPGAVYAYHGDTSWSRLPGELGDAVLCLIEFNGSLYAGTTSNSAGGMVYRYDAGYWNPVGTGLDDQVASLAVFNGRLYAGTAWGGAKLYQYESDGNWTQVISGDSLSPWGGIRALYAASDGWLYLGDIEFDRIARFDGTSVHDAVDLGGSCIWDFAEYDNKIYASAWSGRLIVSENGTSWMTAADEGFTNIWELEPFQDYLYYTRDDGYLRRRNSAGTATTVATNTQPLISMVADGNTTLYFGSGAETGYYEDSIGTGHVYSYSGTQLQEITSTPLGSGVQCLYLGEVSFHMIYIDISAAPRLLDSGGITQLGATAEDNEGHEIIAWHWSDNGAGGTFSPSAEVQNPTWTAPGNRTGRPVSRLLTVAATCNGDPSLTISADIQVVESTSPHYLLVSASATSGLLESGGSTGLYGEAQHGGDHGIASWTWSDNGAGGTFTPSPTVQNPTYTAPGNNSPTPIERVITLTVVCADLTEPLSDSASISIRENPAPHAVIVTVEADPASIASGETTQLSAEATDNYGHGIVSWSWSDNGAGGTFSPSAEVQNPTYTGPGSTSLTMRHLTVTATCDGAEAVSGAGDLYLWEGDLTDAVVTFPAAGIYLFSLPEKNPGRVDGRWILSDLLSDPDAVVSHAGPVQVATWSAAAQAYTYGTLEDLLSPGQGYFMGVNGPCAISLSGVPFELYNYVQAGWNLLGAPSVAVDIRNLASTGQPTSGPWSWNAALQDYEKTYILEPGLGYWVKFPTAGTIGTPTETTALMDASASDDEKPFLDNAATLMDFSDVTSQHWAYNGVTLMRWLGITGGAANDNALNKTGRVTPVKSKTKFKPAGSITRVQLAVFLGRAFDLPISPAPQLDYADVSSDYWAAGYIEAVTKLGIMGEYPGKPGYFYAKKKVSRADLASALARAAGLPLPASVPAVFSDVPADHWAAAEIAALSTQGVLTGDPNLGEKFGPTKPASRAQLAYYLYNLLNEVP